ncbi:MAG: DUF2225 domain-containing protein [Spirochaetales bacterium]|nr:DUF2225 domain-containing protein [Spirochaetales bacterium]
MKVSFFQKNKMKCPVCDTSFYREEMLTGRGRLIAGELTEQLRRLYEPSAKVGEIFPLIYTMTVCPVCFYATLPEDFLLVSDSAIEGLKNDTDKRILSVKHIFEELDFHEPRQLAEGAASYILGIASYDYFSDDYSPVVKQGILALRAAWIFEDLERKKPNQNYDYLAQVMYRKARFFYSLAVEYESNGRQSIANAKHLGPDIDKNFGYDGVLYLASYLEFHHGPRAIDEQRQKALMYAKRTVAKIFGMGRASKDKPSALLEMSRELYATISQYIKVDED